MAQWLAKFDGTCPSCSGPIRAHEDMVQWAPDGTKAEHAECGRPKTRVCSTCWMTHPEGTECL
jgi:hypothetical protein